MASTTVDANGLAKVIFADVETNIIASGLLAAGTLRSPPYKAWHPHVKQMQNDLEDFLK